MNDYKTGYEAGLFAAADYCVSRATALDYSGNEYVRDRALMNISCAVRRLPIPEGMQRQPLTDAQITQCMNDSGWPPEMFHEFFKSKMAEFARAIERAHGIGAAKEPA